MKPSLTFRLGLAPSSGLSRPSPATLGSHCLGTGLCPHQLTVSPERAGPELVSAVSPAQGWAQRT